MHRKRKSMTKGEFPLSQRFLRKPKPKKRIPASGIPTAKSGAECPRVFPARNGSSAEVLSRNALVAAVVPGVTVAGWNMMLVLAGTPAALRVMAVENGALLSGVSVMV